MLSRRARLPFAASLAFAATSCADEAPTPQPPTTCGVDAPWASAPALPLGPTQETAVVALGGKVYVLGGMSASTSVRAAVQIFDPKACEWSLGPDLPHAAHHLNAAVDGDTIYVAGMLAGADFGASAETWAWTPARDTSWRSLANLPALSGRGASAVGVVGGQLVVAGGLATDAVPTVSGLDLATGVWAPLPPLPAPRDHACGAVVEGRLYVIGGRRGTIGAVDRSVVEYTLGGTWRPRAPMPTARGGVACGVVGDRIIVVGGEGNQFDLSGVFSHVEAYDPAMDVWETLPPMTAGRHGMGAAGVDGKLYVPGGATRAGFAATSVVEILTPSFGAVSSRQGD